MNANWRSRAVATRSSHGTGDVSFFRNRYDDLA